MQPEQEPKKTEAVIQQDLNAIIEGHYYGEPTDLVWAVKNYQSGLAPDEQETVKQVVLDRLLEDGSIVNVLLTSCWYPPEAGPRLVALLNRQKHASQLTRMLMLVLHRYDDPDAYRAVERFLDSEQAGEALTYLARMDFIRTVDHLRRAFRRAERCNDCLHILFERRKTLGRQDFVAEFRKHILPRSRHVRRCLAQVLASKRGDYNPFPPAELEELLALCGHPA